MPTTVRRKSAVRKTVRRAKVPAKARGAGTAARVSDEAVRAKTGRNWAEWFRILDRMGAAKLSHREIAARVYAEQGISGWWSQMVTVGYEQARGMRALHERPDGYSISASRTMAVPVSKAFRAWMHEGERNRWLRAGRFDVRKATTNKSLRLDWPGGTTLEVMFYSPSPKRCQVVVQHNKLADAKAADFNKQCWGRALDRLREQLEGGSASRIGTRRPRARSRSAGRVAIVARQT
jgi:activator of Hsp90 ATPase-like protein